MNKLTEYFNILYYFAVIIFLAALVLSCFNYLDFREYITILFFYTLCTFSAVIFASKFYDYRSKQREKMFYYFDRLKTLQQLGSTSNTLQEIENNVNDILNEKLD